MFLLSQNKINMSQDSKKLGKSLGKWNGETEADR